MYHTLTFAGKGKSYQLTTSMMCLGIFAIKWRVIHQCALVIDLAYQRAKHCQASTLISQERQYRIQDPRLVEHTMHVSPYNKKQNDGQDLSTYIGSVRCWKFISCQEPHGFEIKSICLRKSCLHPVRGLNENGSGETLSDLNNRLRA